MRRNRKQCPVCDAETGPGYHFCLACGAELDPSEDGFEMVPSPAVPDPEPSKKKRGRRGKKSTGGFVAVPESYTEAAAAYQASVSGNRKRRSGGHFRLLLVLLVLVGGAVGGMTYWNEHPSNAEDPITWESISEFDYSRVTELWEGDDAEIKSDLLADIPASAVEARAIAVADDGAVMLRVDGKDVIVQLAGVPFDFAVQCLGDKGIARLNRIFSEDAVVYVLPDFDGPLNMEGTVSPQLVYLWSVDGEAERVRYANQELLSSGEAEYMPVMLVSSDSGQQLTKAAERAQQNGRGRYKAGACA